MCAAAHVEGAKPQDAGETDSSLPEMGRWHGGEADGTEGILREGEG